MHNFFQCSLIVCFATQKLIYCFCGVRESVDIAAEIECVLFYFTGNVGVNELLSSLIECVEVFTEHQRVEVREEAERAERELVKQEQDLAYRQSLEADRSVLPTIFIFS